MLPENRCKSKDWQFDINCKFTARETPQHNHFVELGFAVIHIKGIALLIRANVPFKYRFNLFREAFNTATYLDGLIVV
jgi:hypothetical protein